MCIILGGVVIPYYYNNSFELRKSKEGERRKCIIDYRKASLVFISKPKKYPDSGSIITIIIIIHPNQTKQSLIVIAIIIT
jgi:hypothetical protein